MLIVMLAKVKIVIFDNDCLESFSISVVNDAWFIVCDVSFHWSVMVCGDILVACCDKVVQLHCD